MSTATTLVGGLARLVPKPDNNHPAWLTQVRQDAYEWVAKHGFPTQKDEDWRYTRLGPILEVPFVPALPSMAEMGHQSSSNTINRVDDGSIVPADLGGPRLVFINGFFAPELSRLTALPEGSMVTNLASVLVEEAQDLRPFLSRPFGEYDHAFTALNTALAEDGAFIQLAANTTIDLPIQLVFLSNSGGSVVVSSPRSVVIVGPGSRATIVETHVGIPGDVYCTNAVTQVVLESGAQIEHYKIQDESESAFHLALLDVRQSRDSQFSSHSVALGSSIARHEVRVHLEGAGAHVNLDGLYMGRGDQHHDNPVIVEHSAPGCTSRQLYKGVLDDSSQGVFNGRVVVSPGADGTDAAQTNKNLLLSDHAEVDTRPRLEIFADDVKCTHGAAVGQLDEHAVFYLRSRGIPHHAARGLLIYAFVNEMVERLRLAPVRSLVANLVNKRLATNDSMIQGTFS